MNDVFPSSGRNCHNFSQLFFISDSVLFLLRQRTNIKRTIVTTIPRALNDFQMTMSKLQQKQENAFKKVENLIQFIHNHPKFTNEKNMI